MEAIYSQAQLISDLEAIGVKKGELLHLKVSMRALGKVEGGAEGLLTALLEAVGKKGTLVCDSFINSYSLPFKEDLSNYIVDDMTPTYAGAFARAMVNHPDNVRSIHPIKKFSAIGRRAEELMLSHHAGMFAYEPLRVMSEEGARNLTIGRNVQGVGTTHVAVYLVGLERKKPKEGVVYRDSNGELQEYRVDWNGGHGNFLKFIPLYESQGGIIKRANIGKAESILTDMKRTLEIEIAKLKEDPGFFFCDDPACKSCRLSWDHSTGNILEVYYHLARVKLRKILSNKK
jgi:aminoglycoside 3-N-acetyltransferase